MLKAIIFDFDGVIADTFDLSLRINREYGKIITRKQYRDHHNGNVFEEPAIVFTKRDTRKFHKKRYAYADAKHLFPLVGQIENLVKKYKLILISSCIEKVIRKYLLLGGIVKCFEGIFGRETHKSKVEKFRMIFKKYKLHPAECIFVTDTLGDLREAGEVGVPTIAVTWGYHGKTRLKKGKPNLIIHDFKDLSGAISALQKKI